VEELEALLKRAQQGARYVQGEGRREGGREEESVLFSELD